MKADKADRKRQHEAEAERLRQLPRDLQRQIVGMHWTEARNPKIPMRDREFARERAKALEALLRLKRRRE